MAARPPPRIVATSTSPTKTSKMGVEETSSNRSYGSCERGRARSWRRLSAVRDSERTCRSARAAHGQVGETDPLLRRLREHGHRHAERLHAAGQISPQPD